MSEELIPLEEINLLEIEVKAFTYRHAETRFIGIDNAHRLMHAARAAHRLQEEVERLRAENYALSKGVANAHYEGWKSATIDNSQIAHFNAQCRAVEFANPVDAAMKDGGDGE